MAKSSVNSLLFGGGSAGDTLARFDGHMARRDRWRGTLTGPGAGQRKGRVMAAAVTVLPAGRLDDSYLEKPGRFDLAPEDAVRMGLA
ncbi:MAG: hypothetical protein HY814_09035 [Candidatus Riflebacteria bacterium]|nr:hypothetical protein [Candidatus Riflebacteria bacterium]